MNDADVFERSRRLMFSVAYRMLGDLDDAEDAIQEAFLRWSDQGRPVPEAPDAYFAKIVSRLCIDRLRAAQVRRRDYTGQWLPVPFPEAEEGSDASDSVERAQSLSIAFLVVLERLSPLERAVFLLRQAFDYDYEEIAAIVGRSEASCRQLFSRARGHIARNRPRYRPSVQQHTELLQRFTEAYRNGDMTALLEVLAPDSRLVADGGGKAAAAPKPIPTAEAIADFLVRIHRHAFHGADARFMPVNGELALVLWQADRPQTVISLESDGRLIHAVYIQRNPDKLKRFLNNRKQASD